MLTVTATIRDGTLTMDITTTARTVADLAAHMERLRERAISFHQEFGTGDRGYFTPSEDDAVLALWVSYHKSRNALLEVIDSIRHEFGQASAETAMEFAVAFAAALVLVDAARFLRDLFGDDEIVRRKLNESYTSFGIPAGSFDDIQLALTDPTNALRISSATKFYDQNHDLVCAAVQSNQQVADLLDVIDRRIDRIRVTAPRYLKVRLDERRHQLNDAVVQGGLMRAIYAFQQWGSRMVSSLTTMPGHVPMLPAEIAERIRELIRPGDVFVTRKDSAVTNYFLPGYWPHAALYIGDDQVIESLKDGVRQRTLDSPFGNDAVTVLRPTLDDALIDRVIDRARLHVGKPYDFDFDFTRSDRIVCTEVVYRSYEGIGGTRFQLSVRAGRQTLSAEDLLNDALRNQNFRLHAVYCRKYSPDLLTDKRMVDVLAATMAEPAI
jgi:hypothetical protein